MCKNGVLNLHRCKPVKKNWCSKKKFTTNLHKSLIGKLEVDKWEEFITKINNILDNYDYSYISLISKITMLLAPCSYVYMNEVMMLEIQNVLIEYNNLYFNNWVNFTYDECNDIQIVVWEHFNTIL